MDGRPLGWRQIFPVVPRLKERGHTVVDRLYVELKICVKNTKVGVLVWLYSPTRTRAGKAMPDRVQDATELTQPGTCPKWRL
jgi:hypothetical protein